MQFRNGKMYIPTDNGSLSVNGVGYLEIESDLIRLNLGITSDSKSAEEAKDKNLQTLESLITSLTDYGIPKEDINTKDISVTRNYIGCDNQQLSFIVTNLITVMIHDVSKLKDIYSLAIENGANDNINVDFLLSNPTYYYSKALKKASKDALNKAALLASSFNIKFNPAPFKIIEKSSSLYSIAYSSSKSFSSTQQNLSSGLVKITAEIEAIFTTVSC